MTYLCRRIAYHYISYHTVGATCFFLLFFRPPPPIYMHVYRFATYLSLTAPCVKHESSCDYLASPSSTLSGVFFILAASSESGKSRLTFAINGRLRGSQTIGAFLGIPHTLAVFRRTVTIHYNVLHNAHRIRTRNSNIKFPAPMMPLLLPSSQHYFPFPDLSAVFSNSNGEQKHILKNVYRIGEMREAHYSQQKVHPCIAFAVRDITFVLCRANAKRDDS